MATKRRFLYIVQSSGTEYTTSEQTDNDVLEGHIAEDFNNDTPQIIVNDAAGATSSPTIGPDKVLGQINVGGTQTIQGLDGAAVKNYILGASTIGQLEQNAARNMRPDSPGEIGLVSDLAGLENGRDSATDPGQIVLKNLKVSTLGNMTIQASSGSEYVLLDPLVVPHSFSTGNQYFIVATAGATLMPVFRAKQPVTLESGNVVVSRSTDDDDPGIRLRLYKSSRVSLSLPPPTTVGGGNLYNSFDGLDDSGSGILATLKLNSSVSIRKLAEGDWLFLFSEGIEDTTGATSGFTIYNLQISLNFSIT